MISYLVVLLNRDLPCGEQDETWHGVGMSQGHTVLDGDSGVPQLRVPRLFTILLLWQK